MHCMLIEVIVILEQALQNYDAQNILKKARKLREKTRQYPISQKALQRAKRKGRL